LVDGHGVSHPYGLGIASHIGVLIKKPTIGCAKSRLYGEERGDVLVDEGRIIGAVVKCGRPLYVSVGNMITLEDSVALVKKFCEGNMPLPTALAHRYANIAKRSGHGEFDKWGEADCLQ